MGQYLLPFEAASVLLLVALIGAAMIVRRRRDAMIGLSHYLVVSAALFSLGVLGLLTRRNAVNVLMSIELMLNAANVNLVAFSRYAAGNLGGQIFAVFVIVVAAAEVAVGARHRAHALPPAPHAEPRRSGHPEGLGHDHGRAPPQPRPLPARAGAHRRPAARGRRRLDRRPPAQRRRALAVVSPRWRVALGFAFDLQASGAAPAIFSGMLVVDPLGAAFKVDPDRARRS